MILSFETAVEAVHLEAGARIPHSRQIYSRRSDAGSDYQFAPWFGEDTLRFWRSLGAV
jgi:hypothetical protein